MGDRHESASSPRLSFFGWAIASAGFAATTGPIPVTILHTNDLHSHFRPEKTPLQLGGIARLKTAIDQQRRSNPNALLVDGGDWSEGNIYYTEGAGSRDPQDDGSHGL